MARVASACPAAAAMLERNEACCRESRLPLSGLSHREAEELCLGVGLCVSERDLRRGMSQGFLRFPTTLWPNSSVLATGATLVVWRGDVYVRNPAGEYTPLVPTHGDDADLTGGGGGLYRGATPGVKHCRILIARMPNDSANEYQPQQAASTECQQ